MAATGYASARNQKYQAKKQHLRKMMDAMNNTSLDFQEEKCSGEYRNIAVALKKNCGENWIEYLRNFKEEEVFDDDLKHLEMSDLEKLIPRMGPRKRFRKWMKLYTEYNDNAAALGNIRLSPNTSYRNPVESD